MSAGDDPLFDDADGPIHDRDPEHPYVGRGGLKLERALDAFGVDPAGLRCADLGCHVGGFTDCLLRRGAARVFAVDTAYNVLDFSLRRDVRVVAMERTNALHSGPPEGEPPVGLVAMDVGWTVQRLCVPAALRWLGAGAGGGSGGAGGAILSLVKPHYEAKELGMDGLLGGGVLPRDAARTVTERVVREVLPGLGVRVRGVVRSPIRGGKTRGKKTGNVEYVVWMEREGRPAEGEH